MRMEREGDEEEAEEKATSERGSSKEKSKLSGKGRETLVAPSFSSCFFPDPLLVGQISRFSSLASSPWRISRVLGSTRRGGEREKDGDKEGAILCKVDRYGIGRLVVVVVVAVVVAVVVVVVPCVF